MVDGEVSATAHELLEELRNEFKRFGTVVGTQGFKHYKPEKSYVIIDTFLKSGSTLTQQIVYQLICATGNVATDIEGELFDDSSEAVPCIVISQIVWYHETGTNIDVPNHMRIPYISTVINVISIAFGMRCMLLVHCSTLCWIGQYLMHIKQVNLCNKRCIGSG